MKYEEGYPKTMTHPAYMPAQISQENYVGRPDRFPPVTVMSPEHEEDMRARGYLNPGESPARQAHAAEYPKMLAHPLHADAIPSKTEGRIVGGVFDPASSQMVGGHLETFPVPGVPEKYPYVTVKDADEEAVWGAKGYAPNGTWDEAALDRAQHAPDVAYSPDEWPKWIDGQIVNDPNALTPAEKDRLAREYPKMIGDRVVNSASEEACWRMLSVEPESAVLPNTDEALLGASVPSARQAEPSQPSPAPPSELELMREMLTEMLAIQRGIEAARIKELTAQPNPIPMTATIGKTPAKLRQNSGKRKPMSEERRKEVARNFAAGRARRKAEREVQECP